MTKRLTNVSEAAFFKVREYTPTGKSPVEIKVLSALIEISSSFTN